MSSRFQLLQLPINGWVKKQHEFSQCTYGNGLSGMASVNLWSLEGKGEEEYYKRAVNHRGPAESLYKLL